MVNFLQPILLPGEEDRGLPLLRESPLSLDPTSPPRFISKLCQRKKKGRENAQDFKIQNLFSGVAQSLPPMCATHLQWQVREGVNKKNRFLWDFVPNTGPHPPTAHVWDSTKGGFQKRFSGIRPLRGGGYPPIPLREKTFFFSPRFSVKGRGGVPPHSVKKKIR